MNRGMIIEERGETKKTNREIVMGRRRMDGA